MKIRLKPIVVYCQHHVCATFESDSMIACDWMQIDEFKYKVTAMQQEGVKFISLTDAYQHIFNDWLRCKKYAVITFDDGYASLKEILSWLEVQKIPATLFINGKYLDGKSYRKNPEERYLTKDELFALTSSLIEIGSHGWEHVDAKTISIDEFQSSLVKNQNILSSHPRYIPFYAYTYGIHTQESDESLQKANLIPLLVDGADNYNDKYYIHRRLM